MGFVIVILAREVMWSLNRITLSTLYQILTLWNQARFREWTRHLSCRIFPLCIFIHRQNKRKILKGNSIADNSVLRHLELLFALPGLCHMISMIMTAVVCMFAHVR